jgi:Flp pilus assembly protein TadG
MVWARLRINHSFGSGDPGRKSVLDVRAHRPQGRVKGLSPMIPSTFDLFSGETMRVLPFRRRADRPCSQGQSLVEFALVFPIFMLVLGGVIQFGMIFWGQNSLNQVVRDLGRYAVTDTGSCATVTSDIVAQAPTVAAGVVAGTFALAASDVTIDSSGKVSAPANTCPPNKATDYVWISITGHLQVPIFFPFIPVNGGLTSTATFRMEATNP